MTEPITKGEEIEHWLEETRENGDPSGVFEGHPTSFEEGVTSSCITTSGELSAS
jgi:hypothetical protein